MILCRGYSGVMTETQEAPATVEVSWDAIVPHFGSQMKPPALPARPSDGAIRMAQKSYDGFKSGEGENAEILHVMTHRFPTVEAADAAEDELRRAGAYTNPVTTVSVVRDPEGEGDKRIVRWRAGNKRGRKTD